MRLLRRLRCIEIFTFDQCCLGCEARKPTSMALLRLGGFARAVRALGRSGRCGHAANFHPKLQGRDGTGQLLYSYCEGISPNVKCIFGTGHC